MNKFNLSNLKTYVGEDVFILGFPFKPKPENYWLPIWKRGSIATEPNINQDGLPFIYIDTATKSGMSGSPVIIKKEGIATQENNSITLSTNSQFNFIGIYSGRLMGNDPLEAQLGRVWKKNVLDEIIEGGVLGTTSL